MMYIKIDENGEPIDYPIVWENVVGLLDTTNFTEEDLAAHNLAVILNYDPQIEVENCYNLTRDKIIKNDDGLIEQIWNLEEISDAEKVRRWILGPREYYLLSCDWTQLADAPISNEDKTKWAEYRAELRSMTDTLLLSEIKSRDAVIWPIPPSKLSKFGKWANSDADPTTSI